MSRLIGTLRVRLGHAAIALLATGLKAPSPTFDFMENGDFMGKVVIRVQD